MTDFMPPADVIAALDRAQGKISFVDQTPINTPRVHGGGSLNALPVLSEHGDYRSVHISRQQRDTALWDALWQTLDPKLRSSVKETAHDLAEAEQALTGARAQLADIDARPPAKLADVPKRAAARGAVVGEIAQYEVIVGGARQAYEQAARAALTAAQGIVEKQSKQSLLAHLEAEAEYRRRKEAARQYLADANETRDAIGRLSVKVNSGDVDLFR